jgi:hypothetical protein
LGGIVETARQIGPPQQRAEIVERRSFSPRLLPNPAVNSAELLGALLRRTDLARRLDSAPESSITRAAG